MIPLRNSKNKYLFSIVRLNLIKKGKKKKNESRFLRKFISIGLKKLVLERHIKQAHVHEIEAPIAAIIPIKIMYFFNYFNI